MSGGRGRACRRGAHRFRQTCEILFILEHEAPGLLVGEYVLRELGGERRHARIDLGDALLGLGASLAPARTKASVGALEKACLLGIEAETLAALVEIGDALEKLAIEEDRALMGGELRRDIALDRLQGLARIGAGEIEEDIGDLVQEIAALFEREERIGECRLCGLAGDGAHLSLVLPESTRECGSKVLGLDAAEGRRSKRSAPTIEKWVRLALRRRFLCTGRLRSCHRGRPSLVSIRTVDGYTTPSAPAKTKGRLAPTLCPETRELHLGELPQSARSPREIILGAGG